MSSSHDTFKPLHWFIRQLYSLVNTTTINCCCLHSGSINCTEGGKLPRASAQFALEGCTVTYWPVHPFPSAAILDFSVITASLGNLSHRPPPSNKQLPPGWDCWCRLLRAEWQGHEIGFSCERLWTKMPSSVQTNGCVQAPLLREREEINPRKL